MLMLMAMRDQKMKIKKDYQELEEDFEESFKSVSSNGKSMDINGKRKAPQGLHEASSNSKLSRKMCKSSRVGKESEHALLGAELEVMQNFSKVFKNKSKQNNSSKEDDEEDVFAKLIAYEMRKFPERMRFRIKHEINNVIFNYRVKLDESSNNLSTSQLKPLQSPSALNARSSFSQVQQFQ